MASSGADVPAYLTPSPASFEAIFKTLADREAGRRAIRSPRRQQSTAGARIGSTGATVSPLSAYATSVGSQEENRSKNRYSDIIAYDRTRVLLPALERRSRNGKLKDRRLDAPYVNASLVLEPELGIDAALARRYWIAAQAPVASTTHSFLSMLLMSPTSTAYPLLSASLAPPSIILQVTPLVENGRTKCDRYFPSRIGERWVVKPSEAPMSCDSDDDTLIGGSITSNLSAKADEGVKDLVEDDRMLATENDEEGIWIKLIKKESMAGWRMSWLEVGFVGDAKGNAREIRHVEYQNWGDHGVPTSSSHLLDFIKTINSLNSSLSNASDPSLPPSPILIHCSAGVGRTGTYIALSSLLPLLSLPHPLARHDLPLVPNFDSNPTPSVARLPNLYPDSNATAAFQTPVAVRDLVALTVDGLREQRTTMVQTGEQLEWIYSALETEWIQQQFSKEQQRGSR